MTMTATLTWTAVCRIDQLLPERGAAAIFGEHQIAVFRLYGDAVCAIANRDPISGACVLSRGIVGTRGETPVVVSPLHKQAYDLGTGACLDVPGVRVPVYAARVRDGLVEVALRP
jgi:nitrite reductase (NADH) small subunit